MTNEGWRERLERDGSTEPETLEEAREMLDHILSAFSPQTVPKLRPLRMLTTFSALDVPDEVADAVMRLLLPYDPDIYVRSYSVEEPS